MQLSSYQQDIVDLFKTGASFIVQARAGCSKTTTALELLKHLGKKKAIYLAFNKHVATELQKRAPKGVTVKTSHALGYQILSKHFGELNLDTCKANKVFRFIRDCGGVSTYNLEQVWNFYRATVPQWESMSDQYNYGKTLLDGHKCDNPNLMKQIIARSNTLLTESNTIDFSDMVYCASDYVHKNLPYDVVITDESQDLGYAQLHLIREAFPPNTQFIFIGDDRQSINQAFGAAEDCFATIESLFGISKVMPLPITYRCGVSHVELAKKIVPDIESVGHESIITSASWSLDLLVPNGMVIAPTYDLLIPNLLSAAIAGKTVTLKGVECFSGVANALTCSRDAGKTLEGLKEKLEWQIESTPNLPSTADKRRELKAKLEAVTKLKESMLDAPTITKLLNNLSKEKKNATTFTSVHRAKGLESQDVIVLGYDEDNAHIQPSVEKENVAYVALTRSKKNMTFAA